MAHIKKSSNTDKSLFRNVGILGTILVVSFFLLRAHYEAHLSFGNTGINAINTKSSPPTFLYVPHLSFGIPVEQAEIRAGVWKFRSDGASHPKTSSNPGDKGSIIIYGPSTDEVFGKILSLRKNDIVIITCSDGSSHTYNVKEIQIVRPNNRRLFNSGEEQLILFTSVGFGDGKRFVVVATPIRE